MFNKLFNKKGQNTAEYAILIALVIGGVIAMQTYIQRGIQGRMKDGTDYMARQTGETLGYTGQYDPQYTESDSSINRESQEMQSHTGAYSNEFRNRTGSQRTTYSGSTTVSD